MRPITEIGRGGNWNNFAPDQSGWIDIETSAVVFAVIGTIEKLVAYSDLAKRYDIWRWYNNLYLPMLGGSIEFNFGQILAMRIYNS